MANTFADLHPLTLENILNGMKTSRSKGMRFAYELNISLINLSGLLYEPPLYPHSVSKPCREGINVFSVA